MRSLLLVLLCSVACLFSGFSKAGENSLQTKISGAETYRGHYIDFSALAGRKDAAAMIDALRHQIDIVEDVAGLSPQMLEFFRAIPISVNEEACLDFNKNADGKDVEDPQHLIHSACYYSEGLPERSRVPSYGSFWDSNGSKWVNSDPLALGFDTNKGAILVRPITLRTPSEFAQRPIMLHELLHAYHGVKMPGGIKNSGIQWQYNLAKNQKLYPAEGYLMTNQMEFFAVTASIFLYGKDGPMARSLIKERQPDYYKYLVNLFGFDPDPGPSNSPLASAR